MNVDPKLVELAACPICHHKLDYHTETSSFICHADKLIYPIRDGIAVLIKEEATHLTEL
ncbi:Trm112 family protein [Thorsellia anophelis]|uniref:Uncharacterized protein n=1 Tax=Thorsellia anophelis DSM 18579 TaxID=1123402 RepID=A0A1I0C1V5_9GAMM|nr:Trm112 family protein [Thorsellia anophelis]SET12730.1 hypothetical protein SAMN02583745_01437 [Thorsellia anophelis DSM 18579]